VCLAAYPQPLHPQPSSAHRTRPTPGSLSIGASWLTQTHSAGSPTPRGSLASLFPVPGTTDRLASRIRTTAWGGRKLLDPTAIHFHLVLPQVRRPDDYLGAPDGGGDVLTFSTPLLREVLMKYRSLTRKDRACPPRTRLGVLGRLPTTPPSSAQQRTPHPIHPRFTLHPCFLALTNSSRWLTQLTYDHSYAIQSP